MQPFSQKGKTLIIPIGGGARFAPSAHNLDKLAAKITAMVKKHGVETKLVFTGTAENIWLHTAKILLAGAFAELGAKALANLQLEGSEVFVKTFRFRLYYLPKALKPAADDPTIPVGK